MCSNCSYIIRGVIFQQVVTTLALFMSSHALKPPSSVVWCYASLSWFLLRGGQMSTSLVGWVKLAQTWIFFF